MPKVKVSNKAKQPRYIEICETCGADAIIIPPLVEEGKKLHVTYRCENGHEFAKTADLK